MTLEGPARSDRVVTRQDLDIARSRPQTPLLVDWTTIERLIDRSGDTYLWHTVPRTPWNESSLMREHIESRGLDPDVRLAHGAVGLIYALQSEYARDSDLFIRGVDEVRYIAPVFEGEHLRAEILDEESGMRFEVRTEGSRSHAAILGRILVGALAEAHGAEHFVSVQEQQLFSLEQAIGLVSALIGSSIESIGGRVLYMGQRLELEGLVSIGDHLEASTAVVARRPGRRTGERVTTRVEVRDRTADVRIAHGESYFLYMDRPDRE